MVWGCNLQCIVSQNALYFFVTSLHKGKFTHSLTYIDGDFYLLDIIAERGPSFGSGAGAMGHAMRTKSMGSQDLTASAEFASKSGLVSSVAREEVAFDFVGDTIAQLKKK